jgi:4-oxalocrotonate tautomerase
MPFLRISLNKRPSQGYAARVGDSVHRAMVEALGIPEGDRFQVITEHETGLVYDPTFLDVERTDAIVMIQIMLAAGRSVEAKRNLYRTIAERLESELGIRPEDVFVALLEAPVENFSFGKGEAQFADGLPPHLQAAAG